MVRSSEAWGTWGRLVGHWAGHAALRARWAGAPEAGSTYTEALAARNRQILPTLARPMDRYTLVSRRRLDPDDATHATWNLEFEGRGRPRVEAGDMAFLSWRNPPEVVDQVLGLWGAQADRRVRVRAFSSPYVPGRLETLTLAEALARRIDLHEVGDPLLARLGLGALRTHNRGQDREHRRYHHEAARSGGLLVTHPVLDYHRAHLPTLLPDLHRQGLGLEGLLRAQDRISCRAYTLAGFRQVDDDRFRFEITVSQVEKPMFVGPDQRVTVGARSSTFLHSLAVGAEVEGWLLPELHRFPSTLGRAVPLIVVVTGSGVSSLLSLLRSAETLGPVWAFYGVRSWQTKHLYGPELQSWVDRGRLDRLDVAVSRPQAGEGPPRRVQALLWDHRVDLARQIRSGAHVYLCGRLSMGTAVARTLERLLVDQGLAATPAEARATLVSWHHDLRFQASVSGV